ncbi:cupin domain-containing protein [Croceicoccus ponticola]|uniref:Cupin domain-containing protein n=1 Tax=Croceicoccus ponticola TaxID=2217664 RepID=A0A437GZ74_9SPHN|nr:cupin domain-containing protein [Croceicoccus ponticola]
MGDRFAHLGEAGSAKVQPAFAGSEWYEDYVNRTGGEGRLVALHDFAEDWTDWEMHPAGDEMVVCTKGAMVLIQQNPDGDIRIPLNAGEYAINPAGVWHTADACGACTALFVTPARDTAHRPRNAETQPKA